MNKETMLNTLAKALFRDSENVNKELKQKIAKILFDNYADFFSCCLEHGGTDAIPYFQLVNAETLNDKCVFKCVDNREAHPIYQVAAQASDDALKEAFDTIIFDKSVYKKPKESVAKVSDADPEVRGNAYSRFKTPISFGDKITKSTRFKSTAGDYRSAKRLHDALEGSAKKDLWHFFQHIVISDANNLPAHDWLRQLRLLSGNGIVETGLALGLEDATGSSYARYESTAHHINLPVEHAHTILDKNLFDLPVDKKTGKVQENIRTKFLKKFGHFPGTPEQLAARIKSMAITHVRHIAEGGNREDSPIAHIAAGNVNDHEGYHRPSLLIELIKHKSGIEGLQNKSRRLISVRKIRENNPELSLPEGSDYLNLLPFKTYTTDFLLKTEPELSAALAKSLIFEIAENAPTLSSFLARYQEIHGKTMRQIGGSLGVTEARISQLLKNPEELSANSTILRNTHAFRTNLIHKIIETNAFDFPTGADGKILPEVVEAIWKLHHCEKYTSPFLNVMDGARKALITLPQDEATWVSRAESHETPEFVAWMEYWRKLSAQFERNGEVKIEGENVRCFKNADGHVMIHQDDIGLLEESKDYAILLKRAIAEQKRKETRSH